MVLAEESQLETLVLLHGWGMNAAVWQPLVAELEADFRCLALDLPGHGASPPVSVVGDDNSVLLDAWLDALETQLPQQFYLCGWSLGGMLALAVMERWPQRVKGCVLLAAAPRFVEADAWPAMSLSALHDFAQRLDRDVEATLKQFLLLQCLGLPEARGHVRQLADQVLAAGVPSKAGLSQGLALLEGMDLRDAYADGLAERSLAILLGGRDKLLPRQLAPAIRELNADVRVALWPKAGHAPQVSEPIVVANFIREVLL